MTHRLYLSFWDLSLDNLPHGQFEHRVIGAADASAMIRAACVDETLLCVSKEDLLAPYRTSDRRRHEELCAVLRDAYDCPLKFEDFLTTFDEQGTALQSIAPLELAELRPRDRLLIVTCNYEFADKADEAATIEDRFALAADSVVFHLITTLDTRSPARPQSPNPDA